MEEDKSVLTKEQLFREKVNIDLLKKEYEIDKETLEEERSEIKKMREQFEKEKEEFISEMKAERKSLKQKQDFFAQEQILFDKKKKILENGFETLAKDKQKFEQEVQVNRMVQRRSEEERAIQDYENIQSFFNGVNNNLTLKKRYKDLIKIFHPDNVSGDNTTVQLINEEYIALKDEFQ